MGRIAGGSLRIAPRVKLGPEHNPWFWNPTNVSARLAPEWFRTKLHEVGEELEASWNPITERWQIFSRAPRVQYPLCRGWKLLFVVRGADGEYAPLDERVFARLYNASSMAHGSAKEYFRRVEAEMERDRERRERDWRQESLDRAMPHWDFSQIKVSMRGKSNGSKFSTYFS